MSTRAAVSALIASFVSVTAALVLLAAPSWADGGAHVFCHRGRLGRWVSPGRADRDPEQLVAGTVSAVERRSGRKRVPTLAAGWDDN